MKAMLLMEMRVKKRKRMKKKQKPPELKKKVCSIDSMCNTRRIT